MSIREERVWAGSETSLQAAIEAQPGLAIRMAAGPEGDTEKVGPRLLDIVDGLATISIKGALVNSDSPFLEYFGLTGYPEIREAMLAAANDPEVKQILLDIDSGGGAVSGVDDTAKLIRMVNDHVKPVSTFTDGIMASAGYWLGSAAGSVYSGKASLVGSIGIISTFKEYSKQNEMEGVTVTVLRAGKHKALANQNEKLTPEARAQIQKLLDASYGVFIDHVAAMRGKSYEFADKVMGDGQEFIGQAAADIGLTDGITTFDALMTDLKQKIVASSSNTMDNRGNDSQRLFGASTTELSGEANMAKKPLTEQDIAALAAGAASVDSKSVTEVVVDAVAGATDIQADAPKVVIEGESVECLKSEQAESKAVNDQSAMVHLLNSQLATKDAALIEAGIKIAKLEETLGAAQATHAPMLEIVAKSLNNMQIALGGSAVAIEGMGAVAVLAEHKRISDTFQSKFKVGGVAAVSGDTTTNQPQVDPRHLARVNAARFNQ